MNANYNIYNLEKEWTCWRICGKSVKIGKTFCFHCVIISCVFVCVLYAVTLNDRFVLYAVTLNDRFVLYAVTLNDRFVLIYYSHSPFYSMLKYVKVWYLVVYTEICNI